MGVLEDLEAAVLAEIGRVEIKRFTREVAIVLRTTVESNKGHHNFGSEHQPTIDLASRAGFLEACPSPQHSDNPNRPCYVPTDKGHQMYKDLKHQRVYEAQDGSFE